MFTRDRAVGAQDPAARGGVPADRGRHLGQQGRLRRRASHPVHHAGTPRRVPASKQASGFERLLDSPSLRAGSTPDCSRVEPLQALVGCLLSSSLPRCHSRAVAERARGGVRAGVLVRARAAERGDARRRGGVDVHHAARAAPPPAPPAARRLLPRGEPPRKRPAPPDHIACTVRPPLYFGSAGTTLRPPVRQGGTCRRRLGPDGQRTCHARSRVVASACPMLSADGATRRAGAVWRAERGGVPRRLPHDSGPSGAAADDGARVLAHQPHQGAHRGLSGGARRLLPRQERGQPQGAAQGPARVCQKGGESAAVGASAQAGSTGFQFAECPAQGAERRSGSVADVVRACAACRRW